MCIKITRVDFNIVTLSVQSPLGVVWPTADSEVLNSHSSNCIIQVY